jgi:cyclic pyranopterin monophosphate synthase
MNQSALSAIRNNQLLKGDAISVARIAGILAAKKTDELIPLCHSLPVNSAELNFEFEADGIYITSTVTSDGKTGVEMEALTACSVASLTIYDMAKSLDRSMTIYDVKLLSKTGGKSGVYLAQEET